MNLALRGHSHNLDEANDYSFTHDLHKGLYFNYIMANPSFNLKGWYDENKKNDARWADYITPSESNANYACHLLQWYPVLVVMMKKICTTIWVVLKMISVQKKWMLHLNRKSHTFI